MYRVRYIGTAFQRELARRKIPTSNTAPDIKTGPYKKAIAQELLAYLRVAVNKDDPEAFKKCINSPTRGLGKQAVEKLISASRRSGTTLWRTAERFVKYGGGDLSSSQKSGLAEFVRIITSIKGDCTRMGPEEVLRNIHNSVYAGSQKTRSKPIAEGTDRTHAILNEMVQDLELFGFVDMENSVVDDLLECETAQILSRFVTNVCQSAPELRKKRETEVVTLSTVHQAKGLEFPIVFLVRFNDSYFPIPLRAKEGEDLESFEYRQLANIQEERRLAYVAISRAKVSLYISFVNGGPNCLIPSRFLEELPAECMQRDANPALVEVKEQQQTLLPLEREALSLDFATAASNLRSSPAYKPPCIPPRNVLNSIQAAAGETRICKARDLDKQSFPSRYGWDPALPSSVEIQQTCKPCNDPSPTDALLRSRAMPQHTSHLSHQSYDALPERTRQRSPNILASHGDIPNRSLETACFVRHSTKQTSWPSVKDIATLENDHQLPNNSWSDRMRHSIMESLPNFLTSNVMSDSSLGKRSRTVDKTNDDNRDSWSQLSSSVSMQPTAQIIPGTMQQSVLGEQRRLMIRKAPIPSFVLDPDDASSEEEPRVIGIQKMQEQRYHKAPTPLNFSWGRRVASYDADFYVEERLSSMNLYFVSF